MIAAPLIVVWVSSQVLYFKLSTLTALTLSLVLSFACAVVVSRIWERRSRNAEISFSELMIWSWYRLQKAERQLEKGLRDAEIADSREEQLKVLNELTAALESKDPYTRGHSKRVERHSFKTGVAMGLDLTDVELLRMSASLHDVGKIRVSNQVLHKTGALSPEERSLIEEHPALGAEMVASIGSQRIVEAVRHHHEAWDGRGYPDGKSGTEIPLFARVIAVADSYDAIRSTRSYRTGASRDDAVRILTEESGHQFDPEVVEAFLTTLPARGRAVAWFTSLATGPGALWRFLQQLIQRFGSTAIAPVIGAAGTAVIIGTTSLLTPAIPALAYSNEVATVVASPRTSGTGVASQAAAEADDDAAARERERLAARRAKLRQETRERTARRRADAKRERREAAGTSGSGTTAAPATADPKGTTETSGPAPSGETPGGSEEVTGDPSDEGRDCKQGSRERSKGYRLHCDS